VFLLSTCLSLYLSLSLITLSFPPLSTERVTKMKEAKSEAEQIIAAYKKELEANYQANVATMNGSNGAAGSELAASTSKDVAIMDKEFQSKKDQGTVWYSTLYISHISFHLISSHIIASPPCSPYSPYFSPLSTISSSL
jgi:hypothetical protein